SFCATTCAKQADCTAVDAGRICTLQHHVGDDAPVTVCDGERGFVFFGDVGDVDNFVGSSSCLTHVMVAATSICTEICTGPGVGDVDCAADLPTATCQTVSTLDFLGNAIDLPVCVPP